MSRIIQKMRDGGEFWRKRDETLKFVVVLYARAEAEIVLQIVFVIERYWREGIEMIVPFMNSLC
jgi:hypothetical protein